MTPRFGIDTSVLVRLVTGEPQAEFERCVEMLRSLIEDDGAEIVVSNQVVGELMSPFSTTTGSRSRRLAPACSMCCAAAWLRH
jgi:predicted nucleic acid-binding protein